MMSATAVRTGDERAGVILRATALVAVLTVLGSLLGLVRDLVLARLFGATGETDAFLIAWTVPETASPLLVEGAMAFLMVPIFVGALATRAGLAEAVSATLPRVAVLLTAATAALVLAAPLVVRGLAPGLEEHELAVTCTRITAVSVLAFGIAGYLGAALRSAHRFGWAGTIYVAYNVGILVALALLHERLGVVGACVGIAAGGALMVLVQLPGFRRLLAGAGQPPAGAEPAPASAGQPPASTRPASAAAEPAPASARPPSAGAGEAGAPAGHLATRPRVALGVFVPIAAYTVTRQAQVWIERFIGSDLAAGTISHLNYAQKVAQVPMVLAVLLATVTYPMLARSVLAGDTAGGRARMEWDLRVVSAIVLAATAYVVAFASPLIAVLFEHGAFTAADTSVTAAIMRVYALGLLGQAGVAVLSRAYFSGGRPGWQPTLVMGAGLAVTAVVSMGLAPVWHGVGIAAGNAAGITVTAIAFLQRARRRMGVGVAAVGPAVARLGLAAAGAGGVGWALSHLMAQAPATLTLAVGFPVVCAAFVVVGTLARADEVRRLVAAARPAAGARGAVAEARGAVAGARGAAAGARGAVAEWRGTAAGRLRSALGRVRDGT